MWLMPRRIAGRFERVAWPGGVASKRFAWRVPGRSRWRRGLLRGLVVGISTGLLLAPFAFTGYELAIFVIAIALALALGFGFISGLGNNLRRTSHRRAGCRTSNSRRPRDRDVGRACLARCVPFHRSAARRRKVAANSEQALDLCCSISRWEVLRWRGPGAVLARCGKGVAGLGSAGLGTRSLGWAGVGHPGRAPGGKALGHVIASAFISASLESFRVDPPFFWSGLAIADFCV